MQSVGRLLREKSTPIPEKFAVVPRKLSLSPLVIGLIAPQPLSDFAFGAVCLGKARKLSVKASPSALNSSVRCCLRTGVSISWLHCFLKLALSP